MSKLKTKLLIIMMRAIRRIQIEGITAKGHSKTKQDAACGYSAIFRSGVRKDDHCTDSKSGRNVTDIVLCGI